MHSVAKHATCHSFRHYVITFLVSEGWLYDQIQKITGHKSITTLAIYDHADVRGVEDKFRESWRDYDPLQNCSIIDLTEQNLLYLRLRG